MTTALDVVHRWVEARNGRDLDALLELSTPDIEMRLARGTSCGETGLRDWVERMSYGAAPLLEIDGQYARGDSVVLATRTQFRFVETGEPLGPPTVGGAAFEVRDGRVRSFHPDDDLAALLRSAALDAADQVAAT